MISLHQFDHHAVVHRPSDATNALRQVTQTYGGLQDIVRLAIGQFSPTLTDPGAGERRSGTRAGVAPVNADIVERDVLELIKGPEAPAKLRVLGATKPRGRHTELVLEVFHGEL